MKKIQLTKSPRTQIGVLLVLSIGALLVGNAVVAIFAMILLGSMALLPRRSPFLYWPVGLLIVIVLSFFGYVLLWFQSAFGVNESNAVITLGWVTFCLAIVALIRSQSTKSNSAINLQISTGIAHLLTIPSILIMSMATVRFYGSPTALISAFMAGGDHNMHVEITHRLMSWSGWRIEQSPISLTGYPKGLHFLIAELIAVGSKTSSSNHLAQQFLMSAWFDWLQLAAVMQCGVLIIVGNLRTARLRRVIWAIFSVGFICLIENLVSQLFWSGFTTSLGITWVLLLGIAFPWDEIIEDNQGKTLTTLVFLVLFSLASLIIYQPFFIVFFLVLVLYLFSQIEIKKFSFLNSVQTEHFRAYFPLLVFLLVSSSLLMLFLVGGFFGRSFDILLIEGQLQNTNIRLVGVFFALSLLIVYLKVYQDRKKGSFTQEFLSSGLVMGVSALSFGIVLIVLKTSDFGLSNQPYYSQKFLWLTLITSMLFVCSKVLDIFEKITDEWPKFFIIFPPVLFVMFGIIFNLQVSTPGRHGNVDWMARGMMIDVETTEPRSIAVSPNDVLGTHLANLAIRTRTQVNIPIDLALSGNMNEICNFANLNEVLLIYTGVSESDELIAAGCDPAIVYVENGQIKR